MTDLTVFQSCAGDPTTPISPKLKASYVNINIFFKAGLHFAP